LVTKAERIVTVCFQVQNTTSSAKGSCAKYSPNLRYRPRIVRKKGKFSVLIFACCQELFSLQLFSQVLLLPIDPKLSR